MTEEKLIREVVHSALFDGPSFFDVSEVVCELADLEWNDETEELARSVYERSRILLSKAWNFLKDGDYFEE